MSLQETESECAANAVAPRVSLKDIEATIAFRYDLTGDKVVYPSYPMELPHVGAYAVLDSLHILSICILVLRNGFTVIGKSAPASAANFNAELGRKLAYEDCIRQLWPLMGFALRERLSRS